MGHLTSTIMSFLIYNAAFKHNCLQKAYRSVFKLKFIISIKTKEDNLYIMLPLNFMN